jgi:hypothetical protein
VLPRWQRKALAANKTSGDRFIPNRDGMNMDVALMNLTPERTVPNQSVW